MRYLGIDYGEKRIGVAISDEGGSFSFPYSVVVNDKNAISKICGIIQKENIAEVALGLPQNFGRQDTKATGRVRAFAEELKKASSVPVVLVDETLSTAEVIKSGAAPDRMRDAAAAALILRTYLGLKK
ncbi:MAG: Holliday junction resolvase RuvX [Patescibacteria group bacterium]